jgi:hypothetical protein
MYGRKQVFGIDRIARNIGEDGQRGGDHDRRHDRQAIEAVGQVDGVARANDDKIAQDDKADDPERIGDGLEEWNDQLELCRPACAQAEVERDQQDRLPIARSTSSVPASPADRD